MIINHQQLHSQRLPYSPLLWVCGATLLLLVGPWLPASHALHGSALYPGLHLALETLSITVGLMIFVLTWETSHHRRDTDLLLGSGFLAVAVLDFFHSLSYQGMPTLITESSPEKAINFWLMGRLLMALTLLVVSLRPWRTALHPRVQKLVLAVLLCLALFASWLGTWHPETFPRTFTPEAGLTPFKIGSEYLIIALFAASSLLLLRQGLREHQTQLIWLATASWLMALTEFYFTLYGGVTDIYNLLGHLYKITAYGLIYRALVYSVLLEPHQQVAQQHTLLNTLFEAIPELIWLKSPDGKLQATNPAFRDFWGTPNPQGLTAYDITDASRAANYTRSDQQAITSDNLLVFEDWFQDSNGQEHLLEVVKTAIRHDDGQASGVLGIARDITQRYQDQEHLRLAARVFEHTHEGIIITDPRGKIIDTNPAVSRISGYHRDELIGQNPSIFKSGHQGPAFYASLWQALNRDGFWRGEVWNRSKQGELYVELLTISAVYDPQGALTHYVGVFSDITQLREQQQRLEHLAHYDALTQLPNRVLLADRLQQAMAKVRRDKSLLAVCYVDLDGFKPINDALGHSAGDELLIQVAERLTTSLRGSDTVARLGGDEFVVLLSIENREEARQTLARLLQIVAQPYRLQGNQTTLASASIGVTLYPFDNADADTLLRHADQAMYQAKLAGRNRYHLFDPEHHRLSELHGEALEQIRKALENNEFCLYYQPRVNLRLGQVVGAEALLRWQHPVRGLVYPGEFLPMVENSTLAPVLGDWVLHQALAQASQWWHSGLRFTVSVNISALHLQQAHFIERLHELLEQYPGIPLELEILETAALEDMGMVHRLIRACRNLGVNVALDDFGTGYSSLTYLKRLPADVLKIDQTFVRGMLEDNDDYTIVQAVIGLGQAFQKAIVAEGVETEEHGRKLLQMDCELAQGYGIARPMQATEIPTWVQNYQRHPLPMDAFIRQSVSNDR